MNDRIRRLREATLAAVPRISAERARLLMEFERSDDARGASVAVRRAMAFRHLMAHKALHVGDGELIVGERGPAPAATPTYPEVCLHSAADLDVLHSRPKIAFAVDEETRRVLLDEVTPHWRGRTQRERLFAAMTPEWRAAYEAGIFTEFMEQRTPGHTVLGAKMWRCGFLDLQAQVRTRMERLDFFGDPQAQGKREELEAMDIACEAILLFARRHAEDLDRRARAEADAVRRRELETMSGICRRVPAQAPRTFWEALQHYWFIHVGVLCEANPWDSFNPGRLDQHLYPFYRAGLASGELTEERARELLQAFWVKFHDHPAPPKVGVTAAESGTYTDFCLINVGGVKPDGSDASNELSYLILDVVEEMRLLQPSSMVQLSKKNPDRLMERAVRIIRTGFGQPSIFNTDAIVQELVRQGKSIEDARCGGASGCVEAGAFGHEAYILTGYFNLPKILELTLHDGVDPRTGTQLGPKTGDPRSFGSFEQLMAAFAAQVKHFADVKIRGNNVIESLFARHLPVPFLSLLIDDCIEKGMDYHAGGARYNTSYIQGVGIGSVTDALSALREHVYERRDVTMGDLLGALAADFEGHDRLRRTLREETPRYGNDDDRADDIMREVFEVYYGAVNGRPNTRGGAHRIDMLPTTCHVYFGSVTGATPDGRRAGEPLSEGISPVQGADRLGPTAVLKSAAKMDHLRTGGTLLNQKFTPSLLDDEAGQRALVKLVRSYFRLDGHHIQFNVVSAETLRDAQCHPEKYRDLIVRVAGYSDYFINLSDALQDEIIRRTEQQEV